MNGAESLVRSLAASGVEVCFANPGTSEMHFVAALDKVDSVRGVLCLFEGVVTGAADGYARIAGKPAATLLHLGPGLANGLANLHNARRASSPIVNIVGDHATHHARYDAPLTSSVIDFARPVSAWIHTSQSALSVGADAARAVQAARAAPGQIATLILPADTAWDEANSVASALPVQGPSPIDSAHIERILQLLKSAKRPSLLLRGDALKAPGLHAASRIAAATGCRILCDTFAPALDRGRGIPEVERIPYFSEQIVDFLKDTTCLILVGAKPPVAFFAYPGKQSWGLPAHCKIDVLTHPHEDSPAALAALADGVSSSRKKSTLVPFKGVEAAGHTLGPTTIGHVIAKYLPENAIISDDAATSSAGVLAATRSAAPHTHLALTGGSIGQGLPLAIGASVAAPGQKVVCLSGDGAGMYTLQALWTMAREELDVTVVVFANRSYRILNIEMERVGATPGKTAAAMFDLGNPEMNWAMIAAGLGVESCRTASISDFEKHFADAMARKGPHLIEAVF